MEETAVKFYQEIQSALQVLSCSLNLISYSLDQIGLFEMRDMFLKQSSIIVSNEEFKQLHFRETLSKVFQNQQNYFNKKAKIKVLTGPQFKINGAIGALTSLKKNSACQGEQRIGESETNEWYVGSINNDATFCFFFEIVKETIIQNDFAAFQVLIHYQNYFGENKVRVLTYKLRLSPSKNPFAYLDYLDQYAIICVYSKIAALRSLY